MDKAEAEIRRLEVRLRYVQKAQEVAEEAQREAEQERDFYEVRADRLGDKLADLERLDGIISALRDYRIYGWTDRLDEAVRLAG